ncbi:DUF2835 family protein [Halomonas urmiana]|uniref:DUF2835 family protein n=1 Tax=Halomonas urmiana TaxID=490901 RepID=UPI0023D9027D|nr:DUF2835 family protein [Halomonas urmiana]
MRRPARDLALLPLISRRGGAQAERAHRVHQPAETLRRLVTHDGVQGHLRLTFTEAGRFCAIRRLGVPRLHPMNKAGGWCPSANPLIL